MLAISQRGLLYLGCGHCKGSKHCNEAALADLAHTSWLAATERIVTSYGWSVEEEASYDPGLLATILAAVDRWRRKNSQERTFEDAESSIRTACGGFIKSCFSGKPVDVVHVLDAALFVAADAAVTCTAFFEREAGSSSLWMAGWSSLQDRQLFISFQMG